MPDPVNACFEGLEPAGLRIRALADEPGSVVLICRLTGDYEVRIESEPVRALSFTMTAGELRRLMYQAAVAHEGAKQARAADVPSEQLAAVA